VLISDMKALFKFWITILFIHNRSPFISYNHLDNRIVIVLMTELSTKIYFDRCFYVYCSPIL